MSVKGAVFCLFFGLAATIYKANNQLDYSLPNLQKFYRGAEFKAFAVISRLQTNPVLI